MIVTLTKHGIFSYFVQGQLEARLADVSALRAASAVEHCDPLWSPGIPDYDKSTVQVQPSVAVRMHLLATTR